MNLQIKPDFEDRRVKGKHGLGWAVHSPVWDMPSVAMIDVRQVASRQKGRI